jgi:hypothetical protein
LFIAAAGKAATIVVFDTRQSDNNSRFGKNNSRLSQNKFPVGRATGTASQRIDKECHSQPNRGGASAISRLLPVYTGIRHHPDRSDGVLLGAAR